jgi:hypothetical protein
MVTFGEATCLVTLACVRVPDSFGFRNLLDYSLEMAIPTCGVCANRHRHLVIMVEQLR